MNKIEPPYQSLKMHDFSRAFYPAAQQGAANFDFFYCGEGVGYKLQNGNGKRVVLNLRTDLSRLLTSDNTSWLPAGTDPGFDKGYTEPKLAVHSELGVFL